MAIQQQALVLLALSARCMANAAPPALDSSNKWAVIAAGSAGFYNYRHQADACHAYQIMRKSGISEDHIILMMQDDVAGAEDNPFPGKLYNKMGSDVEDVYKGCNVDYKGKKVTKGLFAKVLTGDTSAGGKVLKSGPGDRVFINFVDHGGVGIIAFPNGSPMHAKELSETLKKMQKAKMFKELVFYMEACESGSMFPDLTSDDEIYAVTAANGHESSWGFYCPPMDMANGKHIGSCLGDTFSISWMEDSDLGHLSSETFKKQLAHVTKRVNQSHVQNFGDTSLEKEDIGDFEFAVAAPVDEVAAPSGGEVDSRDIVMHYYMNRLQIAPTKAEREQAEKDLKRVMDDRQGDLEAFSHMAHEACKGEQHGCAEGILQGKHSLKNHECHKALVRTVHEECPKRGMHAPGGWNSYNMKFSQVLVNLCQVPTPLKAIEDLTKIVKQECGKAAVARNGVEVVV
jgi:legumain